MRMAKWFQAAGSATALLGVVCLTHTANASEKSATLVFDANTGNVLHSHKSRQQRYPASLTKMMTIYIIFELIKKQKLSYNTVIVTSREAARRPPSKIGLRPGDKITVHQAVTALITKSANDVATAVAEHIAGTERAFAQLMTEKARELGMQQTIFKNASGLPNKKQVTTAMDMARLALRLRDHFPKQYHRFSTRVFHYKGRTFKNHNTLLGNYRGVDGIKTGYIRASGFNIVTSLRYDGLDIVAVVMGGKTARARDKTMRKLLAKYVKPASRIATKQQPLIRIETRRAAKSTLGSVQDVRSKFNGSATHNQAAHTPQVKQNNTPKPVSPQVKIAKVRNLNILSVPPQQASEHRRTPTRNGSHIKQQSPGLDFARAILQKSPAQPTTASENQAVIQVGAFKTLTEAHRQLTNVSTKAGDLLTDFRPFSMRAIVGQREIYRARFSGYSSVKASFTCQKLKQIGIDCFVANTQ